MKHRRFRLALCLAALLSLALAPRAQAFPGIFVGKNAAPRFSPATQVVIFRKSGVSAVTVMPDYQGPLDQFAWLMPVPADVKLDDVRTLRRDIVDHIDEISAPRFAEFWEMDPCEPGPAEQEWERNLRVSGPGFLDDGMLAANEGSNKKVPKELLVPLDPEFRDSIYKLSMIPAGADVGAWLKGHGYQATDGELAAAARYKSQQFLVIEIDSKTIEIAGTDRALLSPIRFVTQQPMNVASTLGLSNIKDKQELLLYVIDPTSRYEVANYPSVFAPTNLHVDFSTKERMGELYAGLHDLILSKNPGSFVNEYAWSTKGCGQPCANTPLSLAELISLGADAAEAQVPKEELNPKPAEMTDEEKAAYKKLKPKEKKELDAQRKEVARRKALMERNQEFVLSRMHYRYGASDLKSDIELKAASPMEGGIGAPKEGPKGEISTEVKPVEKENRLQSRMINLHESPSQVKCKGRERYRWGKSPRTYHGLRKIWVAEDLANKNRALFRLPEVVQTAVPALGLVPVAAKVEPKEAPAASAAPAESKGADSAGKKDSSCSIAGVPGQGIAQGRAQGVQGWGALILGAFASVFFARRTSLKR